MPVDIVGRTVEDIHKALRGTMPQAAITIIAEQNLQLFDMQRAINQQQAINQKLMKAFILLAKLNPEIAQSIEQAKQMDKKFDADFKDPAMDMVTHQNLAKDE